MEGFSFPPELSWGRETCDPARARISEETFRGRLGPPPLLRHGVCTEERAFASDDRQGEVRASSLLGEQTAVPTVRPKKYHLLNDRLLQDPFDPLELEAVYNKVFNNEPRDEPPCLFPAFTTSAPPAGEGPSYTGAQRGAGAVPKAGKEEWLGLKETMDRQAKLIENLVEQQTLIARQIRRQGPEEERTERPAAAVRGGLIAGPAPIRMQKMTSSDDPEAYLHTFERVAVAAGWPREQWTLILIPCLTGLLQEVVDTLSTQEASQYESVKRAILRTLNLTEETYRKRLRDLKWKPGSHPRTVAQRMRANALRWLKPNGEDSERVVDLIVMEQLVQTLGAGAKNWIQRNNPKTLEKAISLLEDYSMTEEAAKEGNTPWAEKGKPRGGEASLSFSNSSTRSAVEPSGTQKFKGKMFEPFGSKPVRPVTVDQRIYAPGTGWREGKDGRPIYTPGAGVRENKEGRPVCFACGVPGHVRRNCPGADCSWVGLYDKPSPPKVDSSERWEVEAWVNGDKKKALIDTGCAKTLVRDLLGQKKEEGLTVRCIHGDVKKYQTLWATVRVGAEERRMNIGVVPGLSREMLLGRDWVGSRDVGKIKEGLQGEMLKAEDQSDFLQRASREQMRLMQQDDASLQEPLLAAQPDRGEPELESRTAHSEGGACEGDRESVPSSIKKEDVEEGGCVEGVLIELDQTEVVSERAEEVCLVEEGGEEVDLIMWEEIKEGGGARDFRTWTDLNVDRPRHRGVQTEPILDPSQASGATSGFPNLMTGGGLLPDPPFLGAKGRGIEPLEWKVSVFPLNYPGGGRRVIRPGPEYQKKPLEGDWARHPCCGTVCALRSAPLRQMTDREKFGPAPF
uniref:CCHC-type domain-containing protein n=1 Tax=Pogona vitticeps TaxID=103695 RepID=A0ABM5GND3_9SAUR